MVEGAAIFYKQIPGCSHRGPKRRRRSSRDRSEAGCRVRHCQTRRHAWLKHRHHSPLSDFARQTRHVQQLAQQFLRVVRKRSGLEHRTLSNPDGLAALTYIIIVTNGDAERGKGYSIETDGTVCIADRLKQMIEHKASGRVQIR